MNNMNKRFKVASLSVAIAISGTVSLLLLTTLIGQQSGQKILPYFIYQLISLVISATVIAAIYFTKGHRLNYLKLGSLRAKVSPTKLLGIKEGESWLHVGITFTVIISVVTGVFLFLGYRGQLTDVGINSWMLALLAALPLSAINSFNEEIITRWAIVEGLTDKFARYAPWISAVVFGTVHYFGVPGGMVGSVMAGFLAWLLARSIQDTKGIGWAWFIHFCQDILIFTVTIALFI